MTYRFKSTEPDYKIAIKIFGRELIALDVDTVTELNGSKPLLFFAFMLASALIAGLMFLSILAFIYFVNPAIVNSLLGQ